MKRRETAGVRYRFARSDAMKAKQILTTPSPGRTLGKNWKGPDYPVKLLHAIGALLLAAAVGSAHQPQSTMIIAHRGASAHAPENTLPAIRLAIQLGADALEIDVRQTRDGRIVLMHDATVDRTTNGSGEVGDMTFAAIRTLDAGVWFGKEFGGEPVPTLEEVIELLDSSTLLVVEVKGNFTIYPGIERRVVDIVTEAGIGHRTILKSFDRNAIEMFSELAPDIPRLFVYTVRIPWLGLYIDDGISTGDVLKVDAGYLQPHWLFLSASFTKKAQQKGFKVVAWGVNTEAEIRKAIEFGVDGIETDYPDLAAKIVKVR